MAGSVLIIDDDPFISDVLVFVSEQSGLLSQCSSSPKEFSDAALREADYIVLDLFMPELDGIECLRYLSARDVKGRIIVVSNASKRVLRHACATARSYGLDIAGAFPKNGNFLELRKILSEKKHSRTVDSLCEKTSVYPSIQEISRGLERGEFEIALQPQFSLNDASWTGNEVLARWRSPTYGFLRPGAFIDVVEESLLCVEFTLEIVELGLKATKFLSEIHGFDGDLAVNVPPSALSSIKLTESIMVLLNQYDVSPNKFTLELTERQAMLGSPASMDIKSRLAMRGVRFSVDDFGVGQASLERLHDALFDELKIDKSFVDRVATDRQSRVLIESMIDLAHKLEMTVVAEGIETAEAARIMTDLGCDIGQGYYFYRPVPLETLLSDGTLIKSRGRMSDGLCG